MKKILSFLLLGLVLSIGTMWAETITIATKSGSQGTGTWNASSGSVTGTVALPNDLGNISFSLPKTGSDNNVGSNYVTWKKTEVLTVTMPTGCTISGIQLTFSDQSKGPANSSKHEGDVSQNISCSLGTLAAVGESTTVFSTSGTPANSITIQNTMGGEFRLTQVVLTYSSAPVVTYTATYIANGSGESNVVDDAAQFVAANPFTWAGHAFTGWNTAADGLGTKYAVGAALSGNITLYAQWAAAYTVTYKDGTTTLGTEDVVAGGHATGISTTRDLASFVGWFESSELSGDPVNLATLTISENKTLFGKWTYSYAADASYDFVENLTLGTIPNQQTVTTSEVTYDAFQIDNLFFSSMKIAYDNGSSDIKYKGWKIKTDKATIKLITENDRRISITTGNFAGMKITYTPVNAAVETIVNLGGNQANNYNVKAKTLVTIQTTSSSTNVIKAISIEAIPAESDDATLSDLKVDGVTVAGFNASTLNYNIELPYGTSVVPTVTATENDANANAVITPAASLPGTTNIVVTAEDNTTTKTYKVIFSVAPKLSVLIASAIPQSGKGDAADVAGLYGEAAYLKTQSGHKLGSNGHYIGVKMTDGHSFKAGDLLVLNVTETNGASKIWLYAAVGDDKDSLAEIDHTYKVGNNYIELPAAVNGKNALYVYRVSSKCNPTVEEMSIYRNGFDRDGLNVNDWGTICLPAALNAGDYAGAEFYEVVGKDASSVSVASVTALVAGKPYIFKATATKLEALCNGDEVVAPVANNGLHGNLSETPMNVMANAGNYILFENEFHEIQTGATATIAQYRAYLTLSEVEAQTLAPGRDIIRIPMSGQGATDINDLEGTENAVKFIENGKLYILRDGVVYDAMGKMVR